MANNLEVGDVVLCTVDRIVGTIVFVKIDGYNTEGNIITSEIAPGRIRNLRDYVVPKKKIACKVLRISGDRIDLSLRRVTQKEQKELIEKDRQEKSYSSILKTILGEKTNKIIEEIKTGESLFNFIEEAKEDSKKLEKLVGKENSEKILEIIRTQKKKISEIKKEFSLTTKNPEGITLIKKILSKVKDAEIKHLSAGRYSIKAENKDMKSADSKLKEILSEIEKSAKKCDMEFSIKEK